MAVIYGAPYDGAVTEPRNQGVNTPEGTVTFLFTDIEGHTRLWQVFPRAMVDALSAHDRIISSEVHNANGRVVKTTGDGFFAVFASAVDAVRAAVNAQIALAAHTWDETGPLRVRMAMNTGEAELRDGDYFGTAVIRAARLMAIGAGDQILVTGTTASLLQDRLPPGVSLIDLGRHLVRDLQMPVHVYQLQHESLPAEFPALKTAEVLRHNLPPQLSGFVGRERELAEVKALLTGDGTAGGAFRLVTLTGPGGTGKTRLSLQAGRELLDSYADGVWFVELAPVSDPALIAKTAATAFGLRESGGRPLEETLLEYTADKACLVILDNCEHLVAGAARFALTLLGNSPRLQILDSSREALGIPGEVIYQTPPMSLPTNGNAASFAQWDQYDALRLFNERASAASPSFQLSAGNFESLVEICRRLDGIPLALELAAARINMLSLEEIAAHLDDRFRLLTGGSRTALPRQQTLRALIDWSWDLLSEAERLLLARLSVFKSGMTMKAVETVCTDERIAAGDILDLLSGLVNKSLVITRQDRGQQTRYVLLETIRQYAHEKLVVASQDLFFRDCHLQYFSRFGDETGHGYTGRDQAAWLARFVQELGNLRAALDHACSHHKEAGLRLMIATQRLWFDLHPYEGQEWLDKLLANPTPLAPELEALALCALADMGVITFEIRRAEEVCRRSLALFRELGNDHGIGKALHILSTIHLSNGDLAECRDTVQAALVCLRASGDILGVADVLQIVGLMERDNQNYEPAMAALQESMAIYRDQGYLSGIVQSLGSMGLLAIWHGRLDVAQDLLEEQLALLEPLGTSTRGDNFTTFGVLHFRLGNYNRALAYLEEGLAISRPAGDQMSSCWIMVHMGHVYLRMRALEKADQSLRQSLAVFADANATIGIVFALEGLARLALYQNRPDKTARLLAWADSVRATIQHPRPPVEETDVQSDLAAAKALLGDEAFAAAHTTGKRMSREEALAYAGEETLPSSSAHLPV